MNYFIEEKFFLNNLMFFFYIYLFTYPSSIDIDKADLEFPILVLLYTKIELI